MIRKRFIQPCTNEKCIHFGTYEFQLETGVWLAQDNNKLAFCVYCDQFVKPNLYTPKEEGE